MSQLLKTAEAINVNDRPQAAQAARRSRAPGDRGHDTQQEVKLDDVADLETRR